jgi:hypothetical protein
MEEYILVNTKSLKMEIYRKENGRWMYDIYGGHEAITLQSIDVQFPLRDAYINIELEDTLQEESDNETDQ